MCFFEPLDLHRYVNNKLNFILNKKLTNGIAKMISIAMTMNSYYSAIKVFASGWCELKSTHKTQFVF